MRWGKAGCAMQNKSGPLVVERSRFGSTSDRRLEDRDVGGAEALTTRVVLHIELHPLALVELAVAARLDGAEVDEDILALLLRDEAETLGGVEPLDRAGRCHVRYPS